MKTLYKIVIAKFPFIDNPEKRKLRPVLVLTKARSNHQLVVVAYITSKVVSVLDTDISVMIDDPDFSLTGLTHSSVIRLHKLATLAIKDFESVAGEVAKDIQSQVAEKLKLLFLKQDE